MSNSEQQATAGGMAGKASDEAGGDFCAPAGEWRIRPTVLLLIARPRDGAVLMQHARGLADEPVHLRLPGGGLEFGETIEACARREAQEELGAELSFVTMVTPIEFFFHTPGEPHHELGFVCSAGFAERTAYDRPEFRWIDGDGSEAHAMWMAQQEVLRIAFEQPSRFRPRALAALLKKAAADPEFCRSVWAGFREQRQRIRVAARCLFRRESDGRWLVVEAFDEHKGERFFVIPGGGLNFGEASEEGLVREIREELGCSVCDLRLITAMENRFTHRGVEGHEIIFTFTGRLADDTLYTSDQILLVDGGESLVASWQPSSSFRSPERPDLPPLFPVGLLDIMRNLEGVVK